MPLNNLNGHPVTPGSQPPEMRAPTLISATLLLTLASAWANPRETARRLQEQERQIARLETENSQLRWLIHRRGIVIDAPSLIRPETSKATPDIKISGPFHIVRKGESLSQIARKAGTTSEELSALNKITNPEFIRVGQSLRLPESSVATVPASEKSAQTMTTHTVAPGETLYRISINHGMKLDELLMENPGVDPLSLRIGQKLRVPTRTEQATESSNQQSAPIS